MIEKTILDRVPKYAGRIKLTPVSGQADVFDMARADEPTVEGTPLDKATFDSIIQSRLTGRYYTTTATRTAVSTQSGITANPIPQSWQQVDTLNSKSGDWVITVSSIQDYNGHRAVDGDNSTFWRSSQAYDHQITIDTGGVITVKKMKLKGNILDGSLTSLTIRGSNTGELWTTLGTFSTISSYLTEYELTSTGEFRYYQLFFDVSEATAQVVLYHWQFSEYDINTYQNDFINDSLPLQWDTDQRVMIVTPSTVNAIGIAENRLNGITIDRVLQPNMRYELIYILSMFYSKEM